jgi:hypothetical protein
MMSEMVERVARALAWVEGGAILFRKDGEAITLAKMKGFPSGFVESSQGLMGFVDECWPKYRHAAEAAIGAMREPTDEMQEAMTPYLDFSENVPAYPLECWRAAIDEALK